MTPAELIAKVRILVAAVISDDRENAMCAYGRLIDLVPQLCAALERSEAAREKASLDARAEYMARYAIAQAIGASTVNVLSKARELVAECERLRAEKPEWR